MVMFYKLLLIFSGFSGTLLLSVYSYSKGGFPAGRKARYLLIFLRFITLFILFLLLFFRFFSFSVTFKEKPALGIIIDKSDSMNLQDEGIKRNKILNSIITSRGFKDIINKSDPVFCAFGGDVIISKKMPDYFPDNFSTSTNISLAFKKLAHAFSPNKFDSVLLISDGNYNRGMNPVYAAKSMGCPVYVIGVGKDTLPKDLEITNLRTNEISYAGTKINVEVEMSSRGFNKQKVTVNLFCDGNLCDSKIVTLSDNGEQVKALLSFIPKTAGDYLIKAVAPALKGEYTDKNNFRDLKIKVLKSKIKVLMFSGAPDPDVAAISRILKQDPNVEATFRTFKKDGGFYQGTPIFKRDLSSFDVLVLQNIFSKKRYFQRKKYIENILKNFNGSLFVFQSSSAIKDFENYFPCILVPSVRKYIIDVQPGVFLSHPIIANTNISSQKDLPPLYTGFNSINFSLPVNNVLTGTSSKPFHKAIPVISALSTGNKKIVFVWAWGFYKWILRKQDTSFLRRIIENSIRWLALRQSSLNGTVILRTEGMNFESGEEINISCQLYDGLYMPCSQGSVNIFIEKDGKPVQYKELSNIGNGIFTSSVRLSEPGTYTIYASGIIDGKKVGRDTTSFYISDFNAEYQNPASNLKVLKSIADLTNGNFSMADTSLNTFFNIISSESVYKTIRKEIDLFRYPYLFIFLLLLPASEWFLRKKYGLM